VELQDGQRVRNLYDGWGDGLFVPYYDSITENVTATVYREPVGGGSPVAIAAGVGTSDVNRFYVDTEVPTVVTTEAGSGTCAATTGDPGACEVLVRYVDRPVWTELPWGINVWASVANRSLAISGTTLTLTISGTPVTYSLVGKTVEQVKSYLDTHPSALPTAVLSTTAIGEHSATDLLAEFPTTTVPHTGGATLKLRLVGYTLGDSVEGTAYAPKWQVAQGASSVGPDLLSSFTSYSANAFTGTESAFALGIAGDWSHDPKPSVTLNGVNQHFFPYLTSPWCVPVAESEIDSWCTTPSPDSTSSEWVIAPDGCTGYACKTTSESRRLGGHQAWAIQRVGA